MKLCGGASAEEAEPPEAARAISIVEFKWPVRNGTSVQSRQSINHSGK